jgi:hypothetical protein
MLMAHEGRVRRLTAVVLRDYRLQVRPGHHRYVTDAVKRAVLAECVLDAMLARYEIEAGKTEHTDPNLYVDVYRAACQQLGL